MLLLSRKSRHLLLQKLLVSQRAAEIRSRKLCVNCLRSSSQSSKCTSGQCKVCQAKHNTLLHMPSAADLSTNNIDKEVASKATPPLSVLATHNSRSFNSEQVMLSTAVMLVCDIDGSRRRVELCWIADRKRTSYPRNLRKLSV